MRVCGECGGELEAAYRFCPWCASPQRSKLVEFFRAHPRDRGKALRVSRYLTEQPPAPLSGWRLRGGPARRGAGYRTEQAHVRFSVWSVDGVAEAAVSLDEEEAERLAGFLAAPVPARPSAVERLLSRLPRV